MTRRKSQRPRNGLKTLIEVQFDVGENKMNFSFRDFKMDFKTKTNQGI